MLVLSRKIGEKIYIGDDIVIELLQIRTHAESVRLGITAPKGTVILREELYIPPEQRKKQEGAA